MDSQKATGNINSTVIQVNGDYIAMDEGKMTELCLKLINDKLQQLQENAHEIFKAQVISFSTEVFQRIAKMEGKVELLQQFAKPSIQFALGESIMGYSKRSSDDHKELLIEMLLDRLQVDDISTKAILLDKLRKDVPDLTLSQIDVLAFLVFNSLSFDCKNLDDLRKGFQELNPIVEKISHMNSLDFYYLQHTEFVYRISFVDKADFIEQKILKTYQDFLEVKSWENFLSLLDKINPNWQDVFTLIKENSMACYEPTAQGFYLGLIRLGKVLGQSLDYDNFLSQLGA